MSNSNVSGPVGMPTHAERRQAMRIRALKGALLRFNGGNSTMECVVRDVSAGGARLVFGDALAVPSRFDLRLGAERQWRPAAVRWRRVGQVGIAFEDA